MHSHQHKSTVADEENIESIRNSTATNNSHVTASSGEEVASFSSVIAVSPFSSEFVSSIKSEKEKNLREVSSGENEIGNESSLLLHDNVGENINNSTFYDLPPPLPPSLSASPTAAIHPPSNTKITENSDIDPYWDYLFTTFSPNLLDPQDMHSTLDATISKMINNLSPVEVSFIRRRVKEAYRSIHHTTYGGGAGGGNNGDSIVNGSASSNGRVIYSLSNDGGGSSTSGSSQSRFSLTKTVGRLVGYSSSPSSSDVNGTNQHRPNKQMHLPHPALDESFDRTMLSNTIYQKDRLIDITLMRKIFEGGGHCLRKLRVDARKSVMSTVNVGNCGDVHGIGSGKTTPGGSFHVSKGASSSVTNTEPYRRRSFPAISRWSQQNLNGDGKASDDILAVPIADANDAKAIEKVDIFGSAYLLLLYMSEGRWDYVAEIANLSVTTIGLTIDVNNLMISEDNDMEGATHKVTKKIPAPPRPPSFNPPSELYDRPDLSINEPCGVTLSSICYLISMALRGTRRQKVNLLFFLLLPPRELNSILASHPAGGLPTWLLEIDEDVVFSFNSFSFYYYYEGVMLPTFAKYEHNIASERISLCIDAKSSVEILAALVAESLGKQPSNDCIATYGVSRLNQLIKTDAEGEDTITLSRMKFQKVRDALAKAAQDGISTVTGAVNLPRSGTDQIDHFAQCCSMFTYYSNDVVDRQAWSMTDFATWADISVDDTVFVGTPFHSCPRSLTLHW